GLFLLRIEDLDPGRSREAFVEGIEADLAWLGVTWPRPIMRQSRRGPAYREALTKLALRGLLYPCICTRRDIAAAQEAPQEGGAAVWGPDGAPYPGTCREGVADPTAPHALRLDMRRAVMRLGGPAAVARLTLEEIGQGPNGETGMRRLDPDWLVDVCGDVVVSRKDAAAAYHLAVVVDDAAQHVSHVTRGEDLYEAAALHRLLQALLELPVPVWRHHRLIRDEDGRRLAKRDRDAGLAELRAAGETPASIRDRLGLPPSAA
ncbi:MAG: glutamate--tRNA ligase family protein, partial [Pseudomonadota bacterium]